MQGIRRIGKAGGYLAESGAFFQFSQRLLGAYFARFDGSAYLPTHTAGGLIVTTDEASWKELRREVFTV